MLQTDPVAAAGTARETVVEGFSIFALTSFCCTSILSNIRSIVVWNQDGVCSLAPADMSVFAWVSVPGFDGS